MRKRESDGALRSWISIALLTLAGAVAAMRLRNLVHCALALTVAFAGLAVLYLQLDAQFVGFAQVLVYIGAVAILIVFAILLTRSGDAAGSASSSDLVGGLALRRHVFGMLAGQCCRAGVVTHEAAAPEVTVQQIGEALMGNLCCRSRLWPCC